MSAAIGSGREQRDPALFIALRCLNAQRAVAHYDRAAREAEQNLSRVARASGFTLTAASRSLHPHAIALRLYARRAARLRRRRDRLSRSLAVTPATTAAGMRAKLLVALPRSDDELAEALLQSLLRDLRRKARHRR